MISPSAHCIISFSKNATSFVRQDSPFTRWICFYYSSLLISSITCFSAVQHTIWDIPHDPDMSLLKCQPGNETLALKRIPLLKSAAAHKQLIIFQNKILESRMNTSSLTLTSIWAGTRPSLFPLFFSPIQSILCTE